METVSLTVESIARLTSAMPTPLPPICGPVTSQLKTCAADLDKRLGELASLIELLQSTIESPRAVLARELYLRALWASGHGLTDEARADLDASLAAYPYRAGAHLLRAYLAADETAGSEHDVEDALRGAIRLGVIGDQPVAVRAALELAERLQAQGDRGPAIEVLASTSGHLDSVELDLKRYTLAPDEELEKQLRARAPRLMRPHRAEGRGEGLVAYRTALAAVLDAGRAADVDLSTVTLPASDESLTVAEAAELAARLGAFVAERWPASLARLAEQQAAVLADLVDVRDKLEHHRAQPAAIPHVYEKRLRELEASEAELASRYQQLLSIGEADIQPAREALDDALSQLANAETLEDDLGVVPVPPGIAGIAGAR